MTYKYLFCVMGLLLITGCAFNNEYKNYTEIKMLDDHQSLVKDKEGTLYLRYKSMEQCGNPSDYFYTQFLHSNNTNEGAIPQTLTEVIDIDTFELQNKTNNLYWFKDKNHLYFSVTTMCDNNLVIED